MKGILLEHSCKISNGDYSIVEMLENEKLTKWRTKKIVLAPGGATGGATLSFYFSIFTYLAALGFS